MYNVLTAIKNNMLLQELKRLHIWGASTGFEICEVTSDFATLTGINWFCWKQHRITRF